METVKIKIQIPLATKTRVFSTGDVTDWDAVDAKKLIKAGYAEEVKEKK